MSPWLRLAFKNLTRHRRRTALTMVSIIAGVGVFVLGDAFVAGVEENLIVSAEEGTVGHVLARPVHYPVTGVSAPLDRLLDVPAGARALLDREAVAWTGRLLFAPTITFGAESVRARAIGFDPARDATVFPRTHWKIVGALPATDDEVSLSPSAARLLGVKPQDNVVLQVRTHQGSLNALEARVSGIVATGNMAIDSLGVMVPQALAVRLTGAPAPTHVSVRLRARDHAAAFKPELSAALGPLAEVATLAEETAEFLALQQTRRKALNVVVFILLSLAAFSMANTFLMAAWERTREVGTLRALGMTEGNVVQLFLAEGALVGLIGSLLGAAWGGGLAAWWARHPIDFSEMLAKTGKSAFSVSPLVYTRFSTAMVIMAVIVGLVVALLASWYPARVASRLRPADAVRAS